MTGQFDSSLSIGATWSTAAPDRKLVGAINGGKGQAAVSDDGRLNFRKGDMVSNIFKGVHDLQLSWGNSGVFLRGNYWYDFELKDGSRELYDIDDSGRLTAAKASGAQLLDAFFYHNYSIGDLAGSGRVGRQVVSWGESTFIPNSINAINPVSLSALRRPGAELKEALMPVNMLFVSQTLSDALSVEAFYQLKWSEVVVDNCGTFFSSSDLVAKGCDRAVIAGGGDLDPSTQVFIPRLKDRSPRDSGQFGISLKWYAEQLNSTEFGLYAMNYHSRGPNLTALGVDGSAPVPGNPGNAVSSRYFVDYPEDIRLYGLSFQTSIPATGTSLSGEISYRPNMPMQISGNDLVAAAMVPPAARGASFNPLYLTGHAPLAAGGEITGYVRKPFTQVQVTAAHIFPRVLGASRLLLLGEVGFSHIDKLDSANGSDIRFGRDTVFGSGPLTDGSCAAPSKCTTDGFYTSNSWGYRVRGNLEYSNAFMGVALTPSVALSHDVSGYGPTFNEGSKAVSLGLGASYKNTYSASIDYTNFFGGDFNTTTDRDFLSVSFGINF
ncbi:DUF1302 domain-containing protein [Pseudomonas aeruginosa]|uniref:DUF1302 domain-containing protein n=1 Tax=Pseudomonas aeruginosa TaxID=287 RepID=UPI000A96900E